MRFISFIIATAMAAGVVLFYDRNTTIVHIDLFLGKISVAISLAILGAGLLGGLAGGVLVALLKGEGNKRTLREKSR